MEVLDVVEIELKILDTGLGYDVIAKEETPPGTERQPIDTENMEIAVSE